MAAADMAWATETDHPFAFLPLSEPITDEPITDTFPV
jgi:hypothetical protein